MRGKNGEFFPVSLSVVTGLIICVATAVASDIVRLYTFFSNTGGLSFSSITSMLTKVSAHLPEYESEARTVILNSF